MKAFTLKDSIKQLRSILTRWVHEPTLAHLESIRKHELDTVLGLMPSNCRLLEIGAGTGWQARAFKDHGYDVSAIDLPSSNYRENRVVPIMDYDGQNIPFADNTFDIVFSSNALEHIPHIYEFQKEIHRVLKPGGVAVHVIPSGSWRFWTNITFFLNAWSFPEAHGEQAKNAFTEIYYFSRPWWVRLFRETGWQIAAHHANRLFYTGSSVMDSRLDMKVRKKMSRVLGSSCHIFILRGNNTS